MRGSLIVAEGPDGTGKTTIVDLLAEKYREAGIRANVVWFPGRNEGTLGKLVYRLHHESHVLGVTSITPAAMQTLHIAAHLDLIETAIKPLLDSGSTVIMDRYWWSTWVYGLVSGVDIAIIEHLVSAEKAAWGEYLPAHVFLLDRNTPLRHENLSTWCRLREEYHRLCEMECHVCPVHVIRNEQSPDSTVLTMWDILNTRQGAL